MTKLLDHLADFLRILFDYATPNLLTRHLKVDVELLAFTQQHVHVEVSDHVGIPNIDLLKHAEPQQILESNRQTVSELAQFLLRLLEALCLTQVFPHLQSQLLVDAEAEHRSVG